MIRLGSSVPEQDPTLEEVCESLQTLMWRDYGFDPNQVKHSFYTALICNMAIQLLYDRYCKYVMAGEKDTLDTYMFFAGMKKNGSPQHLIRRRYKSMELFVKHMGLDGVAPEAG